MRAQQRGFSLVELVVAITIAGIVLGFMAMFLAAPVNAYLAQERRSDLTDSANNAMRMMENDIRNAVPDSVRFTPAGGGIAMEMLYAEGAARYRSGSTVPDLDIASDTTFNTIGRLIGVPPDVYNNAYLVIANSLGGDAYTLSNVTTPPGTSITVAPEVGTTGEQVITLAPSPVTFAAQSPTRSVYFVRQPVSYVCNPTTGTLRRFTGYPISADQNTHATEADLSAIATSNSLVARDLTACTWAPTAASPYFGGLIRLQMTFSRDGEVVQVFDQVQVENRR